MLEQPQRKYPVDTPVANFEALKGFLFGLYKGSDGGKDFSRKR